VCVGVCVCVCVCLELSKSVLDVRALLHEAQVECVLVCVCVRVCVHMYVRVHLDNVCRYMCTHTHADTRTATHSLSELCVAAHAPPSVCV